MSNLLKQCGCTGIRSCLLCAKKVVFQDKNIDSNHINWYCPSCKGIYSGNLEEYDISSPIVKWCEFHAEKSSLLSIEGIFVTEVFVSNEEESWLIEEINKNEWKLSQSGRRKQDFGPKANFKRKKLKIGQFTGLPSYSQFLVQRMKQHVILTDFCPVELCNLEYTVERGSSIDPHIDDTWLWGEQLVTVNLLSRTLLTLTPQNTDEQLEVQIPLSRKSLIVLAGEARHKWLHSIKRTHIAGKRFAMTFRNLSEEFCEHDIGKQLREIAGHYKGTIVI